MFSYDFSMSKPWFFDRGASDASLHNKTDSLGVPFPWGWVAIEACV